jgi:phosphoglucosamine mutase
MSKLFGTDGIRGTVGADLTPDLVQRVGRALADACRDGVLGPRAEAPRVVIGRDTRVSGPLVELAIVAGLTSGGAHALLAGVLPTPGVAFLTAEMGADAGVVISASHNPPDDNGVKLFGPGGWKLSVGAEEAIERLVAQAGTDGRSEGRVEEVDGAFDRYVDHLVSVVHRDLNGLRVVADCADGAGSLVAPAALERAGADVIALNAEGDGGRINEGCGALHPEVVAQAAEREGAVGLSLDGDADRVLIADETGAIVDGDGIIALVAEQMRADGALAGNGVVVTVMANQALRRWCAGHGIDLVETPVGDRHVLHALREKGLVLGGEQAGHVIRLDQSTTGDGILVGLSVLDIVASRGGRLADVVPFRPLPQVLVNVPTRRANGIDGAERVRSAIVEAERRLGDDGRVLVRPSGTEPLVRVMVEAPDEGLAGQLAELVADAVRREAS